MATIHLPEMVLKIKTRFAAGLEQHETTLTLRAEDVDSDTVADALTNGSSPRVAWQARVRESDDGKIPAVAEMGWNEFLSPEKKARKARTVPMTPEQIAAKCAVDPEFRKAVAASLGISV